MITPKRTSGKIFHRYARVSRSITITSMKLAVIQMVSNLKCEASISTTMIVSESAADSTGRRNSASQKKFNSPQVSRKTALGMNAFSVQNSRPSAAR